MPNARHGDLRSSGVASDLLLAILSVVLALPFANRAHLLRLIVVASVILAVAAAFASIDTDIPALAADTGWRSCG